MRESRPKTLANYVCAEDGECGSDGCCGYLYGPAPTNNNFVRACSTGDLGSIEDLDGKNMFSCTLSVESLPKMLFTHLKGWLENKIKSSFLYKICFSDQK